MKYKNPELPGLFKKQVERAVTLVADNPGSKLILNSRCEFNNEEHLVLACRPVVSQAITDVIFSDSVIDNHIDTLNELLKDGRSEKLYDHAARWLAKELRRRYPMDKSDRKAVTLVEVLVVIAILGILLALVIGVVGTTGPKPNNRVLKDGYSIVVIEECEYIEVDIGLVETRVYSLTHKGNCNNPVHRVGLTAEVPR